MLDGVDFYAVIVKQKPKPSRFGFLSSAKSLVQSVWNRGKSQGAPPSNIPKPAMTVTAVKQETTQVSNEKVTKLGLNSIVSSSKSSLAPAKPTAACASGNLAGASSARLGAAKPSALTSTAQVHPQGSYVSSSTSRSRSPIPSFGDTPTMSPNSSAGFGSGRHNLQAGGSRQSSIVGTGKSRTSATVSSIGTRLSGMRVPNPGSDTIGSMGAKNVVSSASRTSSMGTAASSSSSSRISTRPSTSSRLLAPTASSLAKAARRSSAAITSSSSPSNDLKIMDDRGQVKPALGPITNITDDRVKETGPSPGAIFSKPLLLSNDSGIPTPIKKPCPENGGDFSSNAASSKANVQVKRTLSGRKPRISRSKVIARLASQRAVSGSSVSSRSSSSGLSTGAGILQPQAVARSGRTRSSIGVKVSRTSYGSTGGLKGRASGGNAALAVSAKRRARQSEYLRRKSGKVAMAEADKIEVDPRV